MRYQKIGVSSYIHIKVEYKNGTKHNQINGSSRNEFFCCFCFVVFFFCVSFGSSKNLPKAFYPRRCLRWNPPKFAPCIVGIKELRKIIVLIIVKISTMLLFVWFFFFSFVRCLFAAFLGETGRGESKGSGAVSVWNILVYLLIASTWDTDKTNSAQWKRGRKTEWYYSSFGRDIYLFI